MRFSPDGSLIATASSDLTVRFWRATDGEQLETLRYHTGAVVSAVFLPDGKLLASTGLHGKVNLWDLRGLAGCPAAQDWSGRSDFGHDGETVRILPIMPGIPIERREIAGIWAFPP